MERLGDYTIVRELARGGMGIVYQAHDPAGRDVAIKLILAAADDLDHVRRFEREAEAIARIDHPGVVRIHGFDRDERGRGYIVMDLIDGEPLSEVVAREHPLDPPRAIRIARGLADALAAAHAQGVLHRDVKPSNVLLRRADDQPVLTDFGLARLDGRSRLTKTGEAHGTPAYMPPEQADGALDRIGPASDVYGVGATLFYTLTGRPPFSGTTLINLLRAVLSEPPPRSSSVRPDLPTDLDPILQRCLAKLPQDRYPTADLLRDALDGYRRGERAPTPRRGLAIGALVVSLLLIGALLLYSSQPGDEIPEPTGVADSAQPDPSPTPTSPNPPSRQVAVIRHPARGGVPPSDVGVLFHAGRLLTWASHAPQGSTLCGWSLPGGESVYRTEMEHAQIRTVVAAADADVRLVLLGPVHPPGDRPGHISADRLLSLDRNGATRPIKLPRGYVTAAAVRDDGKKIALGIRNSKRISTMVMAWPPAGGALKRTSKLLGHGSTVNDLIFGPLGDLLVGSGGGTKDVIKKQPPGLVHYDNKGIQTARLRSHAKVEAVAIGPNRGGFFGDTFSKVHTVSLPLTATSRATLYVQATVRPPRKSPVRLERSAVVALRIRGSRLFVQTDELRHPPEGAPSAVAIRVYGPQRRLLGGITEFPNLYAMDVSPDGAWIALGLRTPEDGVAVEVWPLALLTAEPLQARAEWLRQRRR